jgi:hypothetical protein
MAALYVLVFLTAAVPLAREILRTRSSAEPSVRT